MLQHQAMKFYTGSGGKIPHNRFIKSVTPDAYITLKNCIKERTETVKFPPTSRSVLQCKQYLSQIFPIATLHVAVR